MATDAQAAARGFATPAGTAPIRDGDDAIRQNARAATDIGIRLEKVAGSLISGDPLDPITPADIGAAAVDHTHTPASLGAAPANHGHTPASLGAAAVDHTHSAWQQANGTWASGATDGTGATAPGQRFMAMWNPALRLVIVQCDTKRGTVASGTAVGSLPAEVPAPTVTVQDGSGANVIAWISANTRNVSVISPNGTDRFGFRFAYFY